MIQPPGYASVTPLAIPLNRAFDYEIPPELRGNLMPGDMVVVPFGKRNIFAVVTKLRDAPEVKEVKSIIGRVDDFRSFPPDLMRLCVWISKVFLCSIASVLDTMFPFQKDMRKNGFDVEAFRTMQRKLIMDKVVSARDEAVRAAVLDGFAALRRSPSQRRAMETLMAAGGSLRFKELLETANVTAAPVKALIERGYVFLDFVPSNLSPAGAPDVLEKSHVLNMEQGEAFHRLTEAMDESRYEEFLLHGITGSGKTEVYMHAAVECIRRGRTVLVLVPEIALGTQIIQRFLRRSIGRVAVWHSMLNLTERLFEWERIASGSIDIVIGARSAVFAPLVNLGLIIVDEEQESAYKQDSHPRYHGREAAIERARFASCPVVLGSATPSVGSVFNVRRGKATLLTLPERIGDSRLPEIQIVDMRRVMHKRATSTFSPQLLKALKDNLDRKEQSLVFLNHRGYSQFVQCIRCGYSIVCPDCSVSMKYHKGIDILKCHICNHSLAVPESCPNCKSKAMARLGIGTEKIFNQLHRYFKGARIVRMDRDTTSQRGEYKRIITDMEKGEIDILVGTQMIAKGLDFPGVTFVGVVSADSIINMPDFRSAEHTFQILTQVAGRAGRRDAPGRVIVQTLNPEHPAIKAACAHDFESFYNYELNQRRDGRFPPYTRIINCVVASPDQKQARELAHKLGGFFKQEIESLGTEAFKGILGPSEAPLYKLFGKYRWFAGIRGTSLKEILLIVRNATDRLTRNEVRLVAIDVFPAQMM